jgi:hypothetical protein
MEQADDIQEIRDRGRDIAKSWLISMMHYRFGTHFIMHGGPVNIESDGISVEIVNFYSGNYSRAEYTVKRGHFKWTSVVGW